MSQTVTATIPKRILLLPGDDGNLACILNDGWFPVPRFGKGGLITSTTRTYLRLKNITVFRDPSQTSSLDSIMAGPNSYFGTLVNVNRYWFSISIQKGVPQFSQHPRQKTRQGQPVKLERVPTTKILRHNWDWRSGCITDPDLETLTPNPGILAITMTEHVLKIPLVRGTVALDLRPFKVTLVRNNTPFPIITDDESDSMDVVDYHFGKDYLRGLEVAGSGFSLETHKFTQVMTPLTHESQGFIVLGRINIQKNLHLFGLQIPLGYSLIVHKGAIHGDATFSGSYAMAMTVNHHTMNTADVVFLRNSANHNVCVRTENSKRNNIKSQLLPIVFPVSTKTKSQQSLYSQSSRRLNNTITDLTSFWNPMPLVANPLLSTWWDFKHNLTN